LNWKRYFSKINIFYKSKGEGIAMLKNTVRFLACTIVACTLVLTQGFLGGSPLFSNDGVAVALTTAEKQEKKIARAVAKAERAASKAAKKAARAVAKGQKEAEERAEQAG
jgi:hypothetical protein